METKSRVHLATIFLLMVGLSTSGCSLVTLCPPTIPESTAEPCSTPEPCPTLTITPSIVGTWEGMTEPTTITFRFQADGVFIFAMNGTEVDRGQYALLETIGPTGLIIVYDDGTVIYPIFQFLDDNTIKLENSLPGEPRPIGFFDYLVMTRFIP